MSSEFAPRTCARRGVVRACVAAASLAAPVVVASLSSALAQTTQQLPEVTVESKKSKPKAKAKSAPVQPQSAGSVTPSAATGASLTVPNTAEAQAQLSNVPGSVTVVPDTAYKSSTPAVTLKDVLDYVPGIFIQPKWGEDSRLSIRGSGLSRNFHLRSTQLFMDGVPINTADGYGDLQEIDPTAYRYVEVYKGANALRYGANSLGGAINFVTPTGRDANILQASADIGSFGFHRLQASSGGAKGPFDFFVTGSWQEADGFRDHSWGESTRASANLGYKLSPNVETRFYFNASDIMQRIPGAVTRDSALNSPKTAAAGNITLDQQRNIESWRLANKTAFRLSPNTTLETGIFVVDRHLMHPIFQWIDYQYDDYGGFGRITDERLIGGYKNRLIAGVNLHNGEIDNKQFQNLAGAVKGNLLSSSIDSSKNISAYIENSFYFMPDVALVAGTQFLHAVRDRRDRFLTEPHHREPDPAGRLRPQGVRRLEPEAGPAVERQPVLAGVRQRLAQRRGAELRREQLHQSCGLSGEAADRHHLRDRHARPHARLHLGPRRLSRPDQGRAAVPRCGCQQRARATCEISIAPCTRASRSASEPRLLKSMFVRAGTPDKLWLNLAYTFNDFRFDDDPVFGDNVLPGAPRHFLRGELLYKHPTGLFAGPTVEWVPVALYVDNENTTKAVPYTLLGAKFGFDNGGPFSAYIEGRNLTDEHYIASVSITDLVNPNGSNRTLRARHRPRRVRRREIQVVIGMQLAKQMNISGETP